MTSIKIKKLKAKNFMSYKDRELSFNDRSFVKGRNAQGKTTSAHLLYWVLFNKDFFGREAKDIRPHDKDGNIINDVDIVGTVVLDIDGREVEIEKVQKQKFNRKGEFTGNVNIIFVNGVEKSEKDFKVYLSEIIDEETFLLCSNAQSFTRLDNNKRREKLFELIPSFTNEDVIKEHTEFQAVKDILKVGTPEEITIEDGINALKRQLNGKGRGDKGLVGELDAIPIRIDEISNAIEDVSEIEKEIATKENQLQQFIEQESDLDNIYAKYDAIQNSIANLKQEQFAISDKLIKKKERDISIKRQELDKLKREYQENKSILTELESKLEVSKRNLQKLDQEKVALNNEWLQEKAKEFDETQLSCKYCGQEFPQEKQEEMRTRFELGKKNKLDNIVQKGNGIVAEIKNLEEKIETIPSEIESKTKELEELTTKINTLQGIINEMQVKSIDLDNNAEYKELEQKIQEKLSLLNMEQGNEISKQKEEIRNRLKEINQEISELKAKIETVNNAKRRVAELEDERKLVVKTISTCEQKLDLLKEFNKVKIETISSAINKHFNIIQFKMFEQQVNGEYKDTCQMLVNGASYDGKLNTGDKLLAELELVTTFQRINKIQVPVFVDNAGEIDPERIPNTDCQLICLQRADCELTVE